VNVLQQSARLARDLHVLLGAGIAVPEALDRIRSRSSGRWAAGLRKAQEAAESGSSLAQALRGTGHFPRLLVEGLEAATDHHPLARVSQLLEEADWRQRQTRVVLSYPFLLLLAALGLIWLVYGLLGSPFSDMLAAMNLRLPALTLFTLSVVRVVTHPLFVTLEIVAVAGFYWILWSSGGGALRMRLPLLGDWLRRSESISWLNWFDYFLSSGMPVPDSMRQAAAACGDGAFRAKMEAAAAAAERGQDLGKALGREKALPEVALELVARGESLEFPGHYLGHVATVLRREQEAEAAGGLAVLEVVGILIMLLIIPPVIVSFFLPLYQLIGNLGG
jgi:type IV pilus assembly protein PilC